MGCLVFRSRTKSLIKLRLLLTIKETSNVVFENLKLYLSKQEIYGKIFRQTIEYISTVNHLLR